LLILFSKCEGTYSALNFGVYKLHISALLCISYN